MSKGVSLAGHGVYLLDTSILVLSLRGDSSIRTRLATTTALYLSSIALGELYTGAYGSPTRSSTRSFHPPGYCSSLLGRLVRAGGEMPHHTDRLQRTITNFECRLSFTLAPIGGLHAHGVALSISPKAPYRYLAPRAQPRERAASPAPGQPPVTC
jgi:hypothetical protein